MCCVANSKRGGETIFLDVNDLVECLKQDDVKLLNDLLSEDFVHERSGDKEQKNNSSIREK